MLDMSELCLLTVFKRMGACYLTQVILAGLAVVRVPQHARSKKTISYNLRTVLFSTSRKALSSILNVTKSLLPSESFLHVKDQS